MIDSGEIVINEINLPKDKLKNLVRMVWQNAAKKSKNTGVTKSKKSMDVESEPKVEKPKVISTIFSKKFDMSKPPFYQDADKWYRDNFKREDASHGYTYSVRYVGPTLDKHYFVYSKYPHNNDIGSFNDFYIDRKENMAYWNGALKDYARRKWPKEFAKCV